eukprot:203139_1
MIVRYGDKVKLKDDSEGVVKYIGEVVGKQGVFYGLNLNKGNGKNNGVINNQRYFRIRGNKKTGRFVRLNAIIKIIKRGHNVLYTVGDVVNIKRKGTGVVRFVGIPSFSNTSKIMYGVELEVAKGTCSGTFGNTTYFRCKPNHGIYVEQTKVYTKHFLKTAKNDSNDIKEDTQEKVNNILNKYKLQNHLRMEWSTTTNVAPPTMTMSPIGASVIMGKTLFQEEEEKTNENFHKINQSEEKDT